MKIIISFLFFISCFKSEAQQIDSAGVRHAIDSINRMLDNAVVNKQADILNKHYADDFYFKHGSGNIDSKKSWIDNAIGPSSPGYISRTHDSVTVELHKDIAIVKGTLTVRRPAAVTRSNYALSYFRVYVLRKNVWQLLSHNTVVEWEKGPL